MDINFRFGNAAPRHRRRRRHKGVVAAIGVIILAAAALVGRMYKNQPQSMPRLPAPKILAPK